MDLTIITQGFLDSSLLIVTQGYAPATIPVNPFLPGGQTYFAAARPDTLFVAARPATLYVAANQ